MSFFSVSFTFYFSNFGAGPYKFIRVGFPCANRLLCMLSLLKVSQQSKLAAMKGLRNVTIAKKKPDAQWANSSICDSQWFSIFVDHLLASWTASCTSPVLLWISCLFHLSWSVNCNSSEGCWRNARLRSNRLQRRRRTKRTPALQSVLRPLTCSSCEFLFEY